jgi:hypothetical protein
VGAADRARGRLGHAEVLDLPLLDELLHGAGHVLDRHVEVDAVLVEQVDRVDLKPPERGVGDLLDVLRPAGEAGLAALVVELESELGGDHDLPAEGGEGLADELLVDERAVDLGGVEERDTALDGRPDQGDHLWPVRGWAVALAHAHAAEPDGRDLQVTSECALLHRSSSCS